MAEKNSTTYGYLDRIATALEESIGTVDPDNDKHTASTFKYLDRIATAVENGAGGGYGHNVGTSMGGNSGNTQPSYSLGLKTKSALGDHPEYSGLIADTITVYMWERTA